MRKLLVHLFLAYLRYTAKIQLAKIRPKHIIGITGSAGKSSCREAIYAILKEKYQVKQSSSGNSETGLPLDILGFGQEHNYGFGYWLEVLFLTPFKLLTNWDKYEIYIAEMGVDSPHEPKNMSYLLKILRPDIGVFLNVLPVHTEYFQGQSAVSSQRLVEKIAAEKGKLVESLPRSGWAVLNADDPNVAKYQILDTRYKTITFGQKGEIKPFLVDLPGYLLTKDYGYTLAAAATVGKIFDIDIEASKKLLTKNFALPPGRMSIFAGIKNTTIIDSSYNSSRVPAIAALRVLATFARRVLAKGLVTGRKIAVLGDMRELGELAREEHERVADEALKDADYIFAFGPLSEKYFPDSPKIKKYRRMQELIDAVESFLKAGDVILVKGSQNTILLETLVEQLLANPADKAKLCRRGEFWEKKRAELLK